VPNDWEEVYGEALQEMDGAKVADACERARYTINERLAEMAAAKIAMEEEREQLHEALRELLLHQNRMQKPN
jgi:hypothetical protein